MNINKKTLQIFWKTSSEHALQRNLALIFPMLAVVVNAILAPYLLSLFIDKLQQGDVTLANNWPLIASYVGLIFLGEVILWRLALYMSWTFEVNGQRSLYLRIFNKLSHESLAFHANRFGGSLVSQANKLSGSFERFWDIIIWEIIPIFTTLFGSLITLTILGLWQYGIFLFIYALVFAFVVYFFSRFLAKRSQDEADAANAISGRLADIVTNAMTVKSFGREKEENKAAVGHLDDWRQKSTRLKWGIIGSTSAFSTMYTIGAGAAFIFATIAAEQKLASAGLVYLVFIYALNINRQLWQLNGVTRNYNRALGDSYEMTKILSTDTAVVDTSSKSIHAKKGLINFDSVGFSHDDGEGERVFDNFNLTIKSGERVGIVGHSGSGKTTLTRILLRFSDIDSGTITIDDQDISKVSQRSLHQAISYVAQEPLMFHRSLRENIAYGKPDASDEEILAAAKKAHALEFIDKLPDGLETTVGERGVKLSGGQRQRIAIARAILKNAPIMVLDEATSALDSESEKLIQSSLEDLMKNRTSIVIAHRLSTIAKLDRIIVLEDGVIKEDGSHQKLLAKDGIYAKLWNHQSGGFIED